ncbi:hypothetical protein Q5Y73_24630, partial [Chengkuizengella sp. 2205SS18-9]|nr:hypothetical protein [Chengkuizengella sp. 2205SS18-9]
TLWNVDNEEWGYSKYHELDDTELISIGIGAEQTHYKCDSNGFAHFLAYADPSDGVTESTIYTDYVELEIQIDVSELGYDVLIPEEAFPVLSENLLTANQAYPVDLDGFAENKTENVTVTLPEKGVIKVVTETAESSSGWYQDVVEIEPLTTYTASAEIRSLQGTTGRLRAKEINANIDNVMFDGQLPIEWTQISITFTSSTNENEFRFIFYSS